MTRPKPFLRSWNPRSSRSNTQRHSTVALWLLTVFVAWAAPLDAQQASGVGNTNHVLQLDGVDERLEVPTFGAFIVTDITIEFWALASLTGERMAFVLNADDSNRVQGALNWAHGLMFWGFGNAKPGAQMLVTTP